MASENNRHTTNWVLQCLPCGFPSHLLSIYFQATPPEVYIHQSLMMLIITTFIIFIGTNRNLFGTGIKILKYTLTVQRMSEVICKCLIALCVNRRWHWLNIARTSLLLSQLAHTGHGGGPLELASAILEDPPSILLVCEHQTKGYLWLCFPIPFHYLDSFIIFCFFCCNLMLYHLVIYIKG